MHTLSLFSQEWIAVLQNNFVMVLSAMMALDTIWWLCTSVMKAIHWLDHQPGFVSPVESGLERSHFVKVNMQWWTKKIACLLQYLGWTLLRWIKAWLLYWIIIILVTLWTWHFSNAVFLIWSYWCRYLWPHPHLPNLENTCSCRIPFVGAMLPLLHSSWFTLIITIDLNVDSDISTKGTNTENVSF